MHNLKIGLGPSIVPCTVPNNIGLSFCLSLLIGAFVKKVFKIKNKTTKMMITRWYVLVSRITVTSKLGLGPA